MPAEVVELRSEAELREAFPVIHELHGGLDERRYLELLAEMMPAGYRLFVVREPSGDLVATESARSAGHGGMLMGHAEELARREGCEYVALACGREREGTLRFYERRGFERPGYSMRKAL
jgi:GNAT superfamily N-acetyltransferase